MPPAESTAESAAGVPGGARPSEPGPRGELRRGVGRRRVVMASIAGAAVLAFVFEGLRPLPWPPTEGGMSLLGEFLRGGLRPALDYEAGFVPAGAPPFLLRVGIALADTLMFALAAMGLAVVGGLLLAPLASVSFWRRSDGAAPRGAARLVLAGTRVAVALLRSVHEYAWAILFSVAMGLSPLGAVLAIAVPYTGVLAKVFSELIDEADERSSKALEGLGAPRLQAFLIGRFARALPDMAAYGFYRLECALRSSVVLGCFGYPTLGYYMVESFKNLHYREVWTYLIVMVVQVLILERWSSALRRRFVA